MNHIRLVCRLQIACALAFVSLGSSCPPSTPTPPGPATTITLPFDNFRLDVPTGRALNNYDRTFPIYAGGRATDFSVMLSIANLPFDGRVEIQRGDGTILQTLTADTTTNTAMFGGNVGRIRVRLPGLTPTAPDVVLISMSRIESGTMPFPTISAPMSNTVAAFPLALGEPVDFVVSDGAAPENIYFSASGLVGGPFDVILIGAATVWLEDRLVDDFPLSPTEALQPPYTPTRAGLPTLAFPNFALFRIAGGYSTLRMTVTNQGVVRANGVRDPFHGRLIVVPAGPAQALSFPSPVPTAFGPHPIGVDTNPASSTFGTGTAFDQLDCTNWAGVSPASLTAVVAGVPIITPSGPLVCYDGHPGSDFILAPGAMPLDAPVVAAASGFVVQTATGNVDTCYADPTSAAGVSCPGTAALLANFVLVRQDDSLFARYYHLQNEPPPVKPGDRVVCGQYLGHVGSSGISALPHLHFELDALTTAQTGAVVNDVDALINSLLPAVVVDPYPGSWSATLPGTSIPRFVCP